MSSLRSPAHPALLALTVVGAALLVWLLVQGDDEPSFLPEEDATHESGSGGLGARDEATPVADGGRRATEPSTRTNDTPRRSIPRVLPPDAAVEDVRDALALEGEARTKGLDAAVRAIGGLAAQGRKAVEPLLDYADGVEDARIRAVVIASIGRARDAETLRYLLAKMEKPGPSAERLAALIALADPSTDEGQEPATATSTIIPGFRYRFVALPTTNETMLRARRLLGTTKEDLAMDAFPILRLAMRTHPRWARHLVLNDEMCNWYEALPTELRKQVREDALRHADLEEGTRRVIRSAD